MTKHKSISDVVDEMFRRGRITRRQSLNWKAMITHGMPSPVAAWCRKLGMETVNNPKDPHYLVYEDEEYERHPTGDNRV